MVKRISFIVFLLVLIVVVGSGVSVNAQNFSQIDNFTASSYAEYYPCDKSEIELYTLDNYDGYITISGEIIYVNVLDILTPNSSYVEVYETGNDMSTALINAYNNHYDSEFSDAIRKSSATAHYNCHSYAWYSQSPSTNNYWMNDPSNYYEDNGYIEVETPRSGDIICYFDDKGTSTENDDENLHSGIVIEYYSNITSNNICGNSNKVKVISKWGPAGLYEHYGDYCPYVSTYDGDADYVKYYRPKTNASYNLTNYGSQINETAVITSSNDNTNNYEMYELNIKYTKYYEFNVSSNTNLDVRLYDENMHLVEFDDFNESDSIVHFINSLTNEERYYLRVAYDSSSSTGTISTTITSRNTTYLNYGTNNILLNTYNDIVDYYYINERGAGFFKFTVEGTKTDGTTVSLPANALKIYNDSGKLTPMDKFTVTGVSNAAQNKLGENSIITYLPRNGYFYLDIDVSSTDLKSLTINISKVESQEIDLFDLNEDENSTISVLNNSSKGDYIKTLNIEQAGKFTISYNYNGGLTDSFLFILAKQNYNSSTNQYSLTTLVVQLMDGTNDSFTYTGNLEAGKYYIGYLNKNDNSSVVSNFVRYVTLSGEEVLVTDPDQGTLCGSQINIIERNHSNKSYRQTFITVGFTRLIYPNYNYGISPSRLDYDWYSSNTSIATVTNYGTVLGKSAGTVKIMAVLKSDPSKVFVKEFTIINDIGSGIVEIHSTYTVKYSRDVVNGKFHFDMEKINCPYPWLQDYTWSLNNNCHGNSIGASMDNWGDITINGTGCFTLTGTYNVNSRYRVIIHFVIEP